jgi:hypothetical protein
MFFRGESIGQFQSVGIGKNLIEEILVRRTIHFFLNPEHIRQSVEVINIQSFQCGLILSEIPNPFCGRQPFLLNRQVEGNLETRTPRQFSFEYGIELHMRSSLSDWTVLGFLRQNVFSPSRSVRVGIPANSKNHCSPRFH